jgi:putative transposase
MRRRASRGSPNEILRDPGVRPSRSHPAHVPRPRGIARGLLCWSARPESVRGAANRVRAAKIRGIHRESCETYGSPSIWDALVKQEHRVGEHRIAQLMHAEGIRGKTVKKWRATTQSNHRMSVAANALDRQFSVTRPNRVWAVDITYVWTTEGWLYLAVVLDLYSRAVIGWVLEARFTGDLMQQTLTMAIRHRPPQKLGCCTTRIGTSQYAATA